MWCPEQGPGTEEGHRGKTEGLWVKYRLQLIMMCQYRFMSCDKSTILMKDVQNREIECGIYGNSVISSQLLFKPKTSLRSKFIFKKAWP